MAIKKYNPTSPARRGTSVVINKFVSKNAPLKKLTQIIKGTGGRNNQGKITVRHKGGGVKKFYRMVDFRMNKFDVPGKIASIEYDPNRNALIALVHFEDGDKRYVIAHEGARAGDQVLFSQNRIEVVPGNRMPLGKMPAGINIFNVELNPGAGAKICRSAGNKGVLAAIDGDKAIIKLPSGEMRYVHVNCAATVGEVSNSEYQNIRWGKAGRMRHRGIRPTVRGKAMNPVDHRHGGGEARNSIGLKRPVTYTGKPALGVKTRGKKRSDKTIITRRKK